MPDAQQEAGELLMGAALGVQPRDRIPEHLPPALDAFDVLPVRQRSLVHQGRNHPDLAPLGPGDKRVLFVGHNTQQNNKERIPGPRPMRVQYPLARLWAFARISTTFCCCVTLCCAKEFRMQR